jgi:alcohol dehydrogenase
MVGSTYLRALELKNGKISLNVNRPEPRKESGEVLIQVRLAGICRTDLEIRKGYMDFEGIPGHEFVGVVVEDNGEGLVGKRVVAEINCSCGACEYCEGSMGEHCPTRTVIGISGRAGAFADLITVPSVNVHPLPDSLPDPIGVMIEPFAAALKGIDDGEIEPDHNVAVLGDGCLGLSIALALNMTGCRPLLIGKHKTKMKIAEEEGIKTLRLSAAVTKEMKAGFDRIIECTGDPLGLELATELIRPRGRIVMKTTVAKRTEAPLSSLVIDEVDLRGSRCGNFSSAIELLNKKKVPLQRMISAIYQLEDWQEAFSVASDGGSLKVLFDISESESK